MMSKAKIKLYLIPLILLAIVLLLYSINAIRFEENDDSLMLLFASGVYTGTPEFRLVFIHPIYGYLIKTFYNLFSTVEWYTIFFVVLSIVSFSILFKIINKTIRKKPLKIAAFALTFSLFCYTTTLLQFTHIAAICAISGCLQVKYGKQIWLGYILVFFGLLIRFEAALLCIILLAPLFATFSINHLPKISWKPLNILALLVVFTFTTEKFAYQTKKWKDFTTFNKLRGSLIGNPNATLANVDLSNTSVSSVAYKCVQENFTNEDQIGIQELNSITSNLNQKSFFSRINNINRLLHFKTLWIIYLIGLIIILNIKSENKKIAIAIQAIIFCCAFAYLSTKTAVKYRVFYTAFFAITISWPLAFKKGKFWQEIGLSCLILLVSVYWLKLPIIQLI